MPMSYSGVVGANYIYAGECDTLHVGTISDNLHIKRVGNELVGKIFGSYTIVDATGNGDYATLSEAITAGKKYIFVKNGIYNEMDNITLLNDTTLIGESMDGVIFDFGGNAMGLRVGSDIVHTRGTITLTSGSSVITGSGGTLWTTSGVTANNVICTPYGIFEILSVDSDTQITLTETWQGSTSSDINHFIILPFRVKIDGLTIQNSSDNAITINSAVQSDISNICVKNIIGGTGAIEINYCCSIKISDCHVSDTFKNSIVIRGSYDIGIADSSLINSNETGLILSDILNILPNNIKIKRVSSCNNGDKGICVKGFNLIISGCNVENNLTQGILVQETSQDIVIEECIIRNNGDCGIYIRENGTAIRNCTIENNAIHGINLFGNCEVTDCKILENNQKGINIEMGGSKCAVTGCKVKFNGQEGIYVNIPECVICSNIVSNNGISGIFDGIEFTANADNSICDSNSCNNNTRYGIIVNSGCKNCIITTNKTVINTTGGFGNFDGSTSANNNT